MIIKQRRTRPPCVQWQDLNSRINNQESARQRFQSLRLAGIEAYTLSTVLHATLAGSWSNGVNVLEGLHQVLAHGKSTPLDKVDTRTLIDALPPPRKALVDTARIYAADNGLPFPTEEQDNQS